MTGHSYFHWTYSETDGGASWYIVHGTWWNKLRSMAAVKEKQKEETIGLWSLSRAQ